MRKRVDRSTVKHDGIRLIPRTELERTGLWPGSQPEQSDSLELATLRAQLAEAERELTGLRPLPAKFEAERKTRELAEQATHEHRATAIAAEARLSEAEQAAEQERAAAAAALEPLTSGGSSPTFAPCGRCTHESRRAPSSIRQPPPDAQRRRLRRRPAALDPACVAPQEGCRATPIALRRVSVRRAPARVG